MADEPGLIAIEEFEANPFGGGVVGHFARKLVGFLLGQGERKTG
jgi:hypothetical protein